MKSEEKVNKNHQETLQEATSQEMNTNWFESTFLNVLNSAMNKAIGLDSVSQKKLESFTGKVIQVELEKTPFIFQITVQNQALLVQKYDENIDADTLIKGSPTALFAMNSDEPISGLPNVQISGDASTGQYFQKWLKSLQPDWEEGWCQVLGDEMGVRVSDTISQVLAFGKKFKDSMVSNSKDYLVEESRDLIAPEEMEDFLDQVDDLKSDTSHLEQKIQRLKGEFE